MKLTLTIHTIMLIVSAVTTAETFESLDPDHSNIGQFSIPM